MSRLWCALIVVAVFAGCRNSPPVMDPFLTQQTVPPPGTVTAPASAPYYSSPPTSAPLVAPPAGSPMPTTPPPAQAQPPIPYSVPQGFAPAPAGFGKLTPNVSTPGGPLVQPAANMQPVAAAAAAPGGRPAYGPPGGMSYPQAGAVAAAQQPTPAQNGAPGLLPAGSTAGAVNIRNSAAAAAPTVATPAGWQPADNNRSASETPSNSNPAASFASPTGGSAIRIVEPSASAATARAAGDFRPGNTSTLTMPTSGTSSGTLNQSMPRPVVNDITDLPLAQPASYNSAPLPTAAPTAAAAPSGSNFGYDSQYRWVKGKLEYSQSTRSWRLRYIPPDAANDNYGGSVILSDASKLGGFQNGDYVVVYGKVGQAGVDKGSFAALYDVARIEKQSG